MFQKNIDEIREKVITLYKNGDFGGVVDLLDEYGIDDFDILVKKLYSFSLIRLGNISEAQSVLEEILDKTPEDPEVLNALAYIQITKGNKTAALNYLLDAEYYSSDFAKQVIRKNLNLFSEIPDIDTLKSVVKPRDFLFISLPDVKKKLRFPNFRKVGFRSLAILAGSLVAGLVFYVLVVFVLGLFEYRKPSVSDQKISKVDIDTIVNLVDPKPILTNEIILSDREVVSLFNELKILISKDRASNRARFIANYLLNSNASTQVKTKVEILKTFMEEPEFRLDWQPLYEEVNSKPILYDGVYVLWRGKVVNVSKIGDTAEFTFVIYGKDESIVKGFIRARMKNFLDGYISQTISVLGKIYSSKEFFLEVVKVLE